MNDENLTPDQLALVEHATSMLWPIERKRVGRILAGQLRNNLKFARAIPKSGIDVVTFSLASILWLRTASLFLVPALILWVLGAKTHESISVDVAEVCLWVLAAICFVLYLQRTTMVFRYRSKFQSSSK